MSRRTDPVSLIPSSGVVRESLSEARSSVATLEFLLGVSEGIEAFASELPSPTEGPAAYLTGRHLAEVAASKNRVIDANLFAEVASHA